MMLLCLSIDLDSHFRDYLTQYCCAYAQHMRQTSPPNKARCRLHCIHAFICCALLLCICRYLRM